MPVFTLILVRHGETDENKQGIIQGHQDTILADKGERQAQLLGFRLQETNFTHVFSSDLKRAYKTCEILLSHNTANKCTIVQDKRLRERSFGVIEGKHRSDLNNILRQKRDFEDFRIPGGESNSELKQRAISFFQDLCHQIFKECGDSGENGNDCVQTSDKSTETQKTAQDSSEYVHTEDVLTKVDFQNNSATICDTNGDSLQGDGGATKEKHLSVSSEGSQRSSTSEELSSASSRLSSSEHACSISTEKYNMASPLLSPDIQGKDLDFGGIARMLRVLVVTHGGIIRQLTDYFMDELGCEIPGGTTHARRTSPNTGISEYTIGVNSIGEQPVVTCQNIHDQEHLSDEDLVAGQGLPSHPPLQNMSCLDIKPMQTR